MKRGHGAVVKLLLEKGANIKHKDSEISIPVRIRPSVFQIAKAQYIRENIRES